MDGADCVYVTHDWGIHDERWSTALRTLGHEPRIIVLTRDSTSGIRSNAHIDMAVNRSLPILAGPLDTVTRNLTGVRTRLVGLSWGYDLHRLQEDGDLHWLTGVDRLLVDSEATREIAISAGVDASSIAMLPWGVDLGVFNPVGPRTEPAALGLPDDARILLSLRAHQPLYRVTDIIDAFALVAAQDERAHLVIGHAGSLTDDLRRQARTLRLDTRIHFIGRIDETDLPPLLRSADCYVTAASVDGTSVTLLQAMACGAPVIASDTPGNLGWVEQGVTGQVFRVGDVPDLARAIAASLNKNTSESVTRALARVRSQADWARNLTRLEQALFD